MAEEAPTFLFAGGGTGGHLFPGIAVADELLARIPQVRIFFAGSEREVEREIVASAGFRHVALPSPPSTMLRRHPLRFALLYLRACREARRIVSLNRPAAVIGLGGFASVPLVAAAKRLHVPIALLEQNAVAGRATQRLSRRANVICHTYASAVPVGTAGRNAVVTGNPVRRAVASGACDVQKWKAESGKRKVEIKTAHHSPLLTQRSEDRDQRSVSFPPTSDLRPQFSDLRTLLVLGGSQGSTAVNEAMVVAAGELRDLFAGWRVVHQCGPQDRERTVAAYRELGVAHLVQPFFEDLPRRYLQADVAVSRAGGTTLAELACTGVPAVLIPYPNAVKDHQLRNAEVFAHAGAAEIVRQQTAAAETGRLLAAALRSLMTDPGRRRSRSEAMRSLAAPDAAAVAADEVLRISHVASERRPVTQQRRTSLPAGP